MTSTIALLAALSVAPVAADELGISDLRATYGIIGPTRPGTELLPGDNLFLTFDITGICTDADGKVLYSVATEVADAQGKVIFRQKGRDYEAVTALGGDRLPAYAQIDIGLQQPPGDYSLKLTVTDRASKKSKSLTHNFKVVPSEFGIVRLTTSGDADGLNPVGLPLGVGQSLWLNFAVVGFARRGGDKQPNVSFELRVLDGEGKPTLARPFAGSVEKDVATGALAIPVQFHLGLNRAGKFKVEVVAKDNVTGKTARKSFPLVVSAPN
jgi:hypothetical protein